MRSPAEYYIKYLLSDPTRKIQDIDEELAGIDIPVPVDYLVLLSKSLRFPKNYSPLDASHKPSRDFLKKHRIWGLWHPDAVVKGAVEIYQTPGIRDTACTALLGGLKPEMVSELLLNNHGLSVLPESVVEFKHYFWNTDLLTNDQLVRLFYNDKGPSKTNYLAAMRAPRNDPAGTHLALYKLRTLPKSLDTLDMLKSLRDLAYYNALDTEGVKQGRSKSEMVKNYVTVVCSMYDRIKDIEMESEDIITEFMRRVRIAEQQQPQSVPLLKDIIDVEVEESD